MSKEKRSKNNPQQPGEQTKKKPSLTKILLFSNIGIVVVVILIFSGMAVIHQSDTNPSFCASCHIMQPNVDSYLSGNTMDNVHAQAGVECKDCHDYPVSAEIRSGVNFLIGNYEVNPSGTLNKRVYTDEMCLDCHISQEYLAEATDYLFRNPHNSHWGFMPCSNCHISHGEQIDYCASCHDNGSQRMTGDPINERGKIGRVE